MSIYTLRHKDVPVFDCVFEDGYFVRIQKVHNLEHVPVGCRNLFGKADAGLFREWWQRRMLPDIRRKDLVFDSADRMAELNFGCNLSDHYWIEPFGSGLSYSDVNLYENGFSDETGFRFLGGDPTIERPMAYVSPDFCSNGNLKKSWQIMNGRRVLLKSGTGLYRQECLNEILGSKICNKLGVNHVEYRLYSFGDMWYAGCSCMTDLNSELVTAHDILLEMQSAGMVVKDFVEEYMRFGEESGVSDIQKQIGYMTVVDALLRNTDRHWTNFGLMRHPDTLAYTDVIPLFDFGNSLWFDEAQISGRDAVLKFSGRMLLLDARKYGSGISPQELCRCGSLFSSVFSDSDKFGIPRSRILQLQDAYGTRYETLLQELEVVCDDVSQFEKSDFGTDFGK